MLASRTHPILLTRIGNVLLLSAALIGVGLGGRVTAGEATGTRYFRQVETHAAERYAQFEVRFREFIQVVEASLALRRDALELFRALHAKLSGKGHLTAANQQALQRRLARYRENRDQLEPFMKAYGAYSNDEVEVIFPSSRPSTSIDSQRFLGLGSDTRLFINPHDDFGRLMILEIKMWLATKLLFFDNYVVVLVRYLKNSGLRRQFDVDLVDPEGKRFLETITTEFSDGDKYARTVKMVRLVQKIREFERENPDSDLSRDKDDAYLDALIEGSYAYHRIPELSPAETDAITNAITRNEYHDYVVSLTDAATYELSKFFGNAVGLYEERKGKLFNIPPDERRRITSQLKPLDILLEKTPFRLTDLFIPGHWGHVAIWVGDSGDIPDLKRLGVWQELPRIEAEARAKLGYSGPSFQRLIEQDHGVLEALRVGVELNSFASFLNIDDLAIIRHGDLSDLQRKDYLLRAFAQVGKAYDFNFDVESNQTIVCSELAYVVYSDIDWPVEESVGRYTVSPDHIAALARTERDPFTPILIYHDGKALPERYHRHNLNALLTEANDSVIWH